MKRIFILFLLFSISLNAQVKKYRILTSSGEVYYTSNFKESKKYFSYEDENGNVQTIESDKLINVREEIPNWKYFHWGKDEFTDYVVVKIDSLSQKQLFDGTVRWIKETYKNPDEVIKARIDSSMIRIEGYKENVIHTIDSLSQKQLFDGTVRRIKETYKNPDEVIKARIDSSMIRIEGYKENVIHTKVLASTFFYGATYTIDIYFKDGRYEFNPISISYYVSPSKYGSGGDVDISMPYTAIYYNKKGEIRQMFKHYPNSLESLFNDINIGLFNYILLDKSGVNPDDDW